MENYECTSIKREDNKKIIFSVPLEDIVCKDNYIIIITCQQN